MIGPNDWSAALEAQPDSVIVRVYLQPRASRSRLIGLHDSMVKIALAAPPVDGAANKALIQWCSEALGVTRGDVTITSGLSGRRKRVRVSGVSCSHVTTSLNRRLQDQS